MRRRAKAVLGALAMTAAMGLAIAACGDDVQVVQVMLASTKLRAGDLDVRGLTRDGFAAVLDQSLGALAVPLTGDAVQVVDSAADNLIVLNNVIVSGSNWDQVSGFGDLTVWTAAAGAVAFATDSTGVLASSDDGSRLLATRGASSDGSSAILIVGGTDGTPPVSLMAVNLRGACSPRAAFVASHFIASHCDPGSSTLMVSSIDSVTGAVVRLLSGAKAQFVVAAGPPATVVVVGEAGGGAFAFSAAGGAATAIESDVQGLVAAPDGTAVFFRTTGALERVSIAGDPPTILSTTSPASIRGVSRDGRQMICHSRLGPRNGYGDLTLLSAVTERPATILVAALDATTFGDAFTEDSSRALYITEANDLFVGVLQSQAVAGTAAPRVHGRDVWTVRGYAGTRILFNDDYRPAPKRLGTATLRVVDSADDSSRPTVIAARASSSFFVTEARDRVVFSVRADPRDGGGLYVAPLP